MTINPVDHTVELAIAVSEVAERSFFAFAESCDVNTFAGLAAPLEEWYVASVAFRAGTRGIVSCELPGELARQLFSAFTGTEGVDEAQAPDLLRDLLGELANMVCGAWLTRVATDCVFSLGRPQVAALPPGWRPHTAPPRKSEHQILMTLNGLPISALVVVGE